MVEVVFLMILLHIIDDFVFQPICLSKLKQKQYWIDACKNQNLDYEKYQNDYITALLIHGLSWSIMIHLPLFYFFDLNDVSLILSILINTIIHAWIDDMKANKLKINLDIDQTIHIFQIIITFFILKIQVMW